MTNLIKMINWLIASSILLNKVWNVTVYQYHHHHHHIHRHPLGQFCTGMKDLHVLCMWVRVFELYTIGEAEYRLGVRGWECGIDGSHLKRGP